VWIGWDNPQLFDILDEHDFETEEGEIIKFRHPIIKHLFKEYVRFRKKEFDLTCKVRPASRLHYYQIALFMAAAMQFIFSAPESPDSPKLLKFPKIIQNRSKSRLNTF